MLSTLEGYRAAGACLVAMDAPVICPNTSGARPVDREASRWFASYKCGCYPANRSQHPRPPDLARKITRLGFSLNPSAKHSLFEVYPHPTMVRWFGLEERIPYKKGRVTERRHHFKSLQEHLRRCLKERFPELRVCSLLEKLLSEPWSKDVEDLTDALVCSLIAWWHHQYEGLRTQQLGDPSTGLMLVPLLSEERATQESKA
ncbi:MAG: DUF429 domain-containing protein [Limisphaerales bacterium]